MGYQVNDLIIGEIYSVKPYGLFMRFEDNSQGLLHISELSDSYIKDIEKFGSVGDKIKVKVLSIDNTNGFLRVSYKQVPQTERYSTHTNAKRKAPDVSATDFKTLEESLPIWIEETLKKAKKD